MPQYGWKDSPREIKEQVNMISWGLRCFTARNFPLDFSQPLEQPRQFAPVTLRETAANVPFLVDQTALDHRVGEERQHGGA